MLYIYIHTHMYRRPKSFHWLQVNKLHFLLPRCLRQLLITMQKTPPQLQLKDGKLMATFNPRQLNVIWGRDPRYWKMPEKTSGGPAELLQVCLLEVSGSLPIRSSAPSGTKFRITFQVSFKSDAFGWNNCPVCVMAKFGKKGKYTWTKITLRTDYSRPTNILPSPEGLEITKDASNANDTIYFGLYEVWSGKWKGGLELHNATVEQINNK